MKAKGEDWDMKCGSRLDSENRERPEIFRLFPEKVQRHRHRDFNLIPQS